MYFAEKGATFLDIYRIIYYKIVHLFQELFVPSYYILDLENY